MKKTILVIVIILLAAIAYWRFAPSRKPVPVPAEAPAIKGTQEAAEKTPEPQVFEALNGIRVERALAEKRPIAVMVDNHPDARLQSGLADADMVYETVAEGGITRFLAVYQSRDSKNIGPVRSARTYYADMANELGAIYAHVGGNSDVLANIKAGDYKRVADADQFFNDLYFRRISGRRMPHNTYTSTAKLEKLAQDRKYSLSASFEPWKFKDEPQSASTSTASKISIDFSYPSFLVSFTYDQKAETYKRSMGGKPHTDFDTGKQLTAKNVIVQYVDTFPVQSDTPLSIGMALSGQGKAHVFMDGKVIAGTWKKQAGGRTRYYDLSGREVAFNRGTVWVEIVPGTETGSVTWK